MSRFLQLLGLVIVPMALFYYWLARDRASEASLMFGELAILALGALCFILGSALAKK